MLFGVFVLDDNFLVLAACWCVLGRKWFVFLLGVCILIRLLSSPEVNLPFVAEDQSFLLVCLWATV